MGARRLEPWLRRAIADACDQAEAGQAAQVAAIYYSPEAREQIRQAVLRQGRRRGLLLHTWARGDQGQLWVSLENLQVRGLPEET
jgi:electron transfer flavoprotein alpha/beta subunit